MNLIDLQKDKFEYFSVDTIRVVHEYVLGYSLVSSDWDTLMPGAKTICYNIQYNALDMYDKLIMILYTINQNHIFHNGNKRTSLILCELLLVYNKLTRFSGGFNNKFEDFVRTFMIWSTVLVVIIADGTIRIDQESMKDIIKYILSKGRITKKHLKLIKEKVYQCSDKDLQIKFQEAVLYQKQFK